MVVALELGRVRDDFLSNMRLVERTRPEVLRRMRDSARQTCPSCGTPNAPSVKFCGECGTALGASVAPAAVLRGRAPAAERRLVSVLFADLVGFTTALGDSRRRGGAGAAVSLLRHGRATDRALRRHGREVHRRRGDGGLGYADRDRGRRRACRPRRARPRRRGVGSRRRGRRPELAARAGVLTGEAAVTLGAEGQGMVAGDLVNTAVADPVRGRAGLRARRRRDAARERGGDRLRGRGQTRAEGQGGAGRSSAGRCASSRPGGGALKSTGLEPPFVGRDRELRLVKELFHASAEEQTAHLVSVDRHRRHRQVAPRVGVLQVHRRPRRQRLLAPRPLPRVRRRRRLLGARRDGAHALPDRRGRGRHDGACQAATRRSSEHVPDSEERALSRAAPRAAARARGARSHDRHDLFAAWRLFFERLAEHVPDGPRVRGHAVGRREPARLRRVPARVVASQPALRARARPPGAPGRAPDLGRRSCATSRRSTSSRSRKRR